MADRRGPLGMRGSPVRDLLRPPDSAPCGARSNRRRRARRERDDSTSQRRSHSHGPSPDPFQATREVLAYFRGAEIPLGPFRTPGLYRLVRHPMMTGMLMTFWAWPTLTQGRLLLAVAMSGYILAAVKWLEERDLRKTFGAEYERYARAVPMLIPVKIPRQTATSEQSGTPQKV